MADRCDVVVLGMGPGGEVAATRLIDAGLKVAVVERELIGGECAYWACIPSKTLLRPAEARQGAREAAGVTTPDLVFDELARYRDTIVRHYDDSKQVKGYEEKDAIVFKGTGRIAGPGAVEVEGERIEADHIIVATGSDPVIPPIEGVEHIGVWTNREATGLKSIPDRAVVVGGGPVGVEMGQMMARFGTNVTLVQGPDRVLNREEPEVSGLLEDALTADGIAVHTGRNVTATRKEGDTTTVELDDGDTIDTDVVIVATGRRPRINDIGLEAVGVTPGKRGLDVDDRCRVTDGVWAIGDATGTALFTHVAKYQARVVAANILGKPAVADYRSIPRVVFSDPEIAAVGMTAAQAREAGRDVATATIDIPANIARPWTYAIEPHGSLGVIADRSSRVLLGAWAVAPLASEWIHEAVLAVRAEVPITTLIDTVAQFPSFAEAYLVALEKLEL